MKTNAVRMLDSKKIAYEVLSYSHDDGKIDGVSVAGKINRDPKTVFKTLVTVGNSKQNYVFIVPVEEELDLKKAAAAAGEKKVEMLPSKDIQKTTGYIRGGCSPVGMKKLFPTFVDGTAADLEKIVVSAGKIGLQIELKPDDLIGAVNASFADLSK
ncbi:Cys-tRNA(Pro) deacylase [Falsibacillus pallidus]|uniref:Cys-tRNA(Pro)/Cys-tRNA(Cys) deacylase n=1 Tax=Falsibacillus pallidus TaxID=493781 RepID=A0A370GK30_9BACI|nr:Cys-tRNA(Pro) deacylase [Falsibacillus pallidus]RDI42303.1 Cys-tRNA(Pro)/Cys-tRNA(Cys) deacylase [Falsibacillus pallidus]